MKSTNLVTLCLGAVFAIISTQRVNAQVTAPSTYTSAIQVQGEVEGTEFADWASSGIPIATSDPEDNLDFIDIKDIQIANDDAFIYIHLTFHSELSVGTFLGFDLDQDVFTGFDVFTAGLAGVELGYVNDFPFEQDNNIFNTNDPLTGGPIGNGGALIFPFFDIEGSQKEFAIPLDVAFTNPAQAAFSSDTFNLLVYSDQGAGDVSEVITYTLATAPSDPADLNGDGFVDGLDLGVLLGNFNTTATPATGELNGTPPVDGLDLGILLGAWNPPGTVAATAAVPEPSSVALLASVLLSLLFVRRG